MPPDAFDVAIAGGGPAGAAAAIVLARAGLRVMLADAWGNRDTRIGESLTPTASSLLRELGVLDDVLTDGHRPSPGTLAFWGTEMGHANDFLFQLNVLGLQLDRRRFDGRLRTAARAAGAELMEACSLRIESPATSADRPHGLWLRRDGVPDGWVTAHWLIDATGRSASLARRLGAEPCRRDNLVAVYLRLTARADGDRDGRTWVEAVEDGWWYSVLLPDRQRLVAFLTDADLIDRKVLLSPDGLWARMQGASELNALCARHGYHPAGRVRGADASSVELNRAAGCRWLAAGDAGLAFDPLSSKGIGNALYTGIQAARTVLSWGTGDKQAPQRYADHLREIHSVYRDQSRVFYGMETRWPWSSFWQRRKEPVPGNDQALILRKFVT